MKGLISYSSKTGNTKALAEVVAETLSGDHDITLLPVGEVKDTKDYDFILHGLWVRMTGIDPLSKKFLQRISPNTPLGLFGTSGGEHAYPHSERLDRALEEAMDPFDSLGVKLTYGKVDPSLLEKIDGIIGHLLPKKMKEMIIEMSKHSREATEEERRDIAEFFKDRLKERREKRG